MMYSEKLYLILCMIYRQPTNNNHKSDAPEFSELIFSIQSKINSGEGCTPDLYICGDFIYLTTRSTIYTNLLLAAVSSC